MFQPAKDFLRIATQKYKLGDQAVGALVCTRFRNLLTDEFVEFVDAWEPQHFKKGMLTVKAANSAASSALFLHTHNLVERINQLDLPEKVIEIKITR